MLADATWFKTDIAPLLTFGDVPQKQISEDGSPRARRSRPVPAGKQPSPVEAEQGRQAWGKVKQRHMDTVHPLHDGALPQKGTGGKREKFVAQLERAKEPDFVQFRRSESVEGFLNDEPETGTWAHKRWMLARSSC